MRAPARLRELASFVRHVATHPSPLANRAAALGRFARRQLHKRLTREPMRVTWEGMQLEVPGDAHFAAAAYYMRRPDWWEFAFIESFLRPGDTVFDVGANVGVYGMFFAKCVGPGGRVVSCEPDEANVARLRRNRDLNGLAQLELVEQAVGDHVGEVRFVVGEDTVSRLESVAAGARTVTVPMTTLDALVERSGKPRLVKVDVEGAEPLVLAGAKHLLAADDPPVLLLEVQDSVVEALESVAAGLGWTYATYDTDRRTLVPTSPRDRRSNNVLLVRDLPAIQRRMAGR